MSKELATAYVGRDPEARGEYARFCFSNTAKDPERQYCCDWCGSTPKRVYSYLWQNDSIGARVPTRSDAKRAHKFCGVGCFRSFSS